MTTPVPIVKVLKEHLDELTEEELKRFQWFLTKNVREGCKSIQRSQLEKVTREGTVDKMVQVYGRDGAVETTVDILTRMNHNDLAVRLTQAITEANMEQQSNEPSTLTVSEMQRDADWTPELSCPVCRDIFTEPVMLQCGHSFCKTCVHKDWKGELYRKCPYCQQVIDLEPQINYTLKSLSENYRRRGQSDPTGGHSNDSASYQSPSRTIRLKQEAFEKVKQFCDSSIEHIQSQRRTTEQKMRDDFEKLRHFLKTEEESRITALQKEETHMIRMMQKITEISRDTFSLSDTVKEMEDLGADDSFIQNFKTEMERIQNALPDPQLLPQALIDVPEHVENLQFRVLETMLSTLKHTPVVLDPNTASPWLFLSDDLTKVTVTDTCQEHPGNLEHNSSYPHVLGWEGFDSGKHCWEMVVGKQTKWRLGVTERAKDRRDDEMWSTPQNGLYVIMKSKRGYTDVKGKLLKSATRPNKIRIKLDYENGTVSFYDADNNTLILTYEETFTQRLYPYFAFVKTDDDDNDEGVKRKRKKVDSSGGFIQICESKVSLTVT